ncbi:hypothetical protein A5717_26005 [Mycolicibacterium porcinum]|uniref:hypothetical protein n=1 Tax=Mycolicibacterium porcinum TaxID=39693 RepID=UPI00080B7216|nr:hypothetical protein [Mycolicibacterium porcinum]OCB09232.1 hypothetical protein A5717_26005 [Mycolicibacterium porcinum]
MAALATHVAVRDDDGTVHSFGPDSDVPEWAARKITNPNVWEDGEAPFPADDEGVDAAGGGGDDDLPPPLSGKGSGEDKWRAYADRKGVDVSDLADRGDIIDRLRDRGVRVE